MPDLLLAGYEATSREEFFNATQDFMSSWDRFERGTWPSGGILWNDHATAARVRVLAEFWRIYRTRPDYDPEVGRRVLEQADRYGYFLSDPGHFTFSTNHGVMQNLGLLQLALAFPELPRSAEYHRVALARLDRQMRFFIDGRGVIRENSAGYQAFGLEILAMTFRTMALLGDPVPSSWADRYRKGIDYLAALRRPDGTLPATGDTDGASLGEFPRITTIDARGMAGPLHPFEAPPPRAGQELHPAAGYWIDWAGAGAPPRGSALSQTLVTWNMPPAPGHKHADEMSVLLWWDSTSWLTSVGYWPYTEAGRGLAEGWAGSNAPHITGEPHGSDRTTRLLSWGGSPWLAAVDLERTGPGDYRARRQVVRAGDDFWLILDRSSGLTDRSGTTIWTLDPGVELSAGPISGSYRLRSIGDSGVATLTFAGSEGTSFSTFRGSMDPFAGWHVVRYQPVPTTAVRVEQPGPAPWLATVIRRGAVDEFRQGCSGRPDWPDPDGAENWTVCVATAAGRVELRRVQNVLIATRIVGTGSSADTLSLQGAPDVTSELSAIRAAFDSMSLDYPRFRPLWPQREKASYLVVMLLIGQELVLLAVRRLWPSAHRPLRVASLFCWAGVAAWLHFDFLRSWEYVTPSMGSVPFLLRRVRARPGHFS